MTFSFASVFGSPPALAPPRQPRPAAAIGTPRRSRQPRTPGRSPRTPEGRAPRARAHPGRRSRRPSRVRARRPTPTWSRRRGAAQPSLEAAEASAACAPPPPPRSAPRPGRLSGWKHPRLKYPQLLKRPRLKHPQFLPRSPSGPRIRRRSPSGSEPEGFALGGRRRQAGSPATALRRSVVSWRTASSMSPHFSRMFETSCGVSREEGERVRNVKTRWEVGAPLTKLVWRKEKSNPKLPRSWTVCLCRRSL